MYVDAVIEFGVVVDVDDLRQYVSGGDGDGGVLVGGDYSGHDGDREGLLVVADG